MIVTNSNGLSCYQFSSLISTSVEHGIFTRHGGISPSPYASLNLGGTSGDEPNNIIENRKRVFDFFNRPVNSIFDVWQVHGNEVINTERPRPLDGKHLPADGIITRSKDVTLLMRFADCVPILIFDPINNAIGLVHAGWQGTVKRVVQKTINRMQSEFHSQPQDLLVGIGPSIGPDHYVVGAEVTNIVKDSLGEIADKVISVRKSKTYFDLWLANTFLLNEIGVHQIEGSGLCTMCHNEDWYSYRKEGQKSGRFAVLIGLTQ